MILVFFVNIKHPLLQRDIMVKMHWKTLQKSFQSYESSNHRQYRLMDCKRCFVLILQPSSSAFIPLLAVPVISMLEFFHVCSFLYGCFCFLMLISLLLSNFYQYALLKPAPRVRLQNVNSVNDCLPIVSWFRKSCYRWSLRFKETICDRSFEYSEQWIDPPYSRDHESPSSPNDIRDVTIREWSLLKQVQYPPRFFGAQWREIRQ